MTFAAPIWLVALLPWLGIVLWMFGGLRQRRDVPFLNLWRTSDPMPRSKRSVRLPPLAICCLLLAMFLGIVGAAGPTVPHTRSGQLLVIIVDRHLTLTSKDELVEQLQSHLHATSTTFPVDLVLVPDGSVHRTDRAGWAERAIAARPTSLPTSAALRSAVRDALERTDQTVIVISGQNLGTSNDQLIQLAPRSVPQNVGIIRVAAREMPAAQVMVSVRNESPQSRAELIISSGHHAQQAIIDLPAQSSEQDYFIEMPEFDSVISVVLRIQDEIVADNYAWLVRQRGGVVLEIQAPVAGELVRMIEVYRKHRPADASGPRVIVTDTLDGLDGGAGVVIPHAMPLPRPEQAVIQRDDHPITAALDWQSVLSDARAAPLAGDWRTILSVGGQAVLAVRDAPVRQVWVGFESASFARSTDFVIFWTNVFDWLADTHVVFASERMHHVSSDWRRADNLSGGAPLPIDPPPGIYVRADGAVRALNAIDVQLSPPISQAHPDWRERLDLQRARGAGRLGVSAYLLIAALVAVLLAAVFWSGNRRSLLSA